MKHPPTSDELRFVDPSIDPSTLWDTSKSLAEIGLESLLLEIIRRALFRFPTVEYAAGFDGVDDWVRVEGIEIKDAGVDVTSKIWIEDVGTKFELFDIVNSNGESEFRLENIEDKPLGIQAVYRNRDGLQRTVLYGIQSETWQELRLWSDGNVLEIEVGGSKIGYIPDIVFQDDMFTFYFGRGNRRFNCFRGMVKDIQILSGGVQLFKLETENGVDITDEANSDVIGVHNLKKDRFNKEFRS